ncbi:MAG: hypothetical protein H6R26_2857 [Proteobacteria bacterium]|nr:hypothetical protein [Pseudomonadota bacterium]
MQTESSPENDTQHNQTHGETLESEVSHAAARDDDVEESVRKLTFDALSIRALDRESLRLIINAVVEGARRGVHQEAQMTAAQVQAAQERLTQSMRGLDVALAQFAQASKLALEEAVSRAQAFREDDLAKARSNLESLESMFLETVKTSARAATGFAAATLHDIALHAERHGTAVGTELKETLAVFVHHTAKATLAQVETGLQLAHATADLMRNMAAGVLSGVADRLKEGRPPHERGS